MSIVNVCDILRETVIHLYEKNYSKNKRPAVCRRHAPLLKLTKVEKDPFLKRPGINKLDI
jgi:hypothetical protein